MRYAFVLTMLVFAPTFAVALARAPMETPANPQPPPVDIRPNISGNVNASVQPTYVAPYSGESAPPQASPQEEAQAPSETAPLPPGSSSSLPWVAIGACIIALAALAWWLRAADRRAE